MWNKDKKVRFSIDFNLAGELLGIFLILLIVLIFWGEDIARVLGEAAREFIEAKEKP